MSKKEPEKYPHFMELRVFFGAIPLIGLWLIRMPIKLFPYCQTIFLPLPHFVREADFGVQFIGIQMCLSLCYSFNIIRLFILVVYYM